MNNFFSNENNAVPNGYIYTSHTGSKYVFLEGLWFNDSNMMLVDPQKYPNMYLSARQQISEHNRKESNKFKIGSTYIHENVECTFIGSNRFQSENGQILENVKLTELMADDHRVYNVSKDTLRKEWDTLKFYILPPYADDISIPAGMEINGFKFIPKGQRFVNTQTGQAVDPAMTRKLSDDCLRVARQNVSSNTLIPLKSVLVQGNTRAEWNGKNFCDNDGNVIIPEQEVSQIFNAYEQFVKANPQDFPTLTNGGSGYQEQRFASVEKPAMPIHTKESINEADGDSPFSSFEKGNTENPEIPHKFAVGDYTYDKKIKRWLVGGKPVKDSTLNKELNTHALKDIKKLDSYGDYPVNSKVVYKGVPLVWNGTSWTDNDSGKAYRSSKFMNGLDDYLNSNPQSSVEEPQKQPEQQSEPEQSVQEPEQAKVAPPVQRQQPSKTKGVKALVPGKSGITDANGKRFIYQGGYDFESSDGEKFPAEQSKQMVDNYNNGVQTQSAHNSTDTKSSKKQVSKADNKPEEVNSTKPVKELVPGKSGITDANGKRYVYQGGYDFESSDGEKYPEDKSKQMVDNYNSGTQTSSTHDASVTNPTGKSQKTNNAPSVKALVPGKSGITDANGKRYVYQGGYDFESSDGEKYPEDKSRQMVDNYNKGVQTKSTHDASASKSSETNSSSVPDGYQMKANSGKTYTKQDGSWVDTSTNKRLNSSAAQSVERAASKRIAVDPNATYSVHDPDAQVPKKVDPNATYSVHDPDAKLGHKIDPNATYSVHDPDAKPGHKIDPNATYSVHDPDAKPATHSVHDPDAQVPKKQKANAPQVTPQEKPEGKASVESLASKIKSSPFAQKIKVLLTRGDKISLMAADILLSGKRDEVVDILKSLNNNDE